MKLSWDFLPPGGLKMKGNLGGTRGVVERMDASQELLLSLDVDAKGRA